MAAQILDAHSLECMKSEADIFYIQPTQTVVEGSQWIPQQSVALIPTHGPIEFRVACSDQAYIDAAQTTLKITASLVNAADGTPLAADVKIAPVNLTLHSLFNQIDVSLGQRLISDSTSNYAYRAYLESLLNFSKLAKQTQLQSSMFYKDTAGSMDETDPTAAGGNNGLKSRFAWFSGSKSVEMEGRLHVDLCAQEKFLISGIDLNVKLHRAPITFSVMRHVDAAAITPVWRIDSAVLKIRKVEMSASLRLEHEKALMVANAKIPITRVKMNVYSVPAGAQTLIRDDMFNGRVPKRVVIGMVSNAAYNGDFTKNPFRFKHYDMSEVAMFVDNVSKPGEPIVCDFENDKYVSAYNSLFISNGKFGADEGMDIDLREYKSGYTLTAYNLSPDHNEGHDHLNLLKHGNTKLSISLKTVLPETAIVLVYAEFDNMIEITKERTVLNDFDV